MSVWAVAPTFARILHSVTCSLMRLTSTGQPHRWHTVSAP